MQNKDYYLYKHTNLINGKCYIGITCQTPEQRWRSGLGYKDQSKFYGAILKYGWNSFSHEILYKNLSQEEAYNLEKKLIAEYDSIENGYNIQQGGEDVGIWAREHLGATIYKLDPTDFHIIYQYDSISNASRELSVSPTAIANAIQVRGECLGYYWCKEDKYDNSWKPKIKENLKAIYMIDRNTFEIIKEYDSIISATKETGISYSGLRRCDEFYSLGGILLV